MKITLNVKAARNIIIPPATERMTGHLIVSKCSTCNRPMMYRTHIIAAIFAGAVTAIGLNLLKKL